MCALCVSARATEAHAVGVIHQPGVRRPSEIEVVVKVKDLMSIIVQIATISAVCSMV